MPNSVFVDGAVHPIDAADLLMPNGSVRIIDEGRVLDEQGALHYIAIGSIFLNRMPVGTKVYAQVDGVRQEFVLIQKGNPDPALYGADCDGLWIMQTRVYESRRNAIRAVWPYAYPEPQGFQWPKLVNDSQSQAQFFDPYINGMDTAIRNSLLTPELPYAVGLGAHDSTEIKKGDVGQVFALSAAEVGFDRYCTPGQPGVPFPGTGAAKDGAPFQYFKDHPEALIAESVQRPGTKVWWGLRSGFGYHVEYGGKFQSDDDFVAVLADGKVGNGSEVGEHLNQYTRDTYTNLRPCMVLRKDALIDKDNNIVLT